MSPRVCWAVADIVYSKRCDTKSCRGRRCRRSSCGLEEGLSQMGKIYCLGCFLGVLGQMARIPGLYGWRARGSRVSGSGGDGLDVS